MILAQYHYVEKPTLIPQNIEDYYVPGTVLNIGDFLRMKSNQNPSLGELRSSGAPELVQGSWCLRGWGLSP